MILLYIRREISVPQFVIALLLRPLSVTLFGLLKIVAFVLPHSRPRWITTQMQTHCITALTDSVGRLAIRLKCCWTSPVQSWLLRYLSDSAALSRSHRFSEVGSPLGRGERPFFLCSFHIVPWLQQEYIHAITAYRSLLWHLFTLCHCTTLGNIRTRHTSAERLSLIADFCSSALPQMMGRTLSRCQI
jgi:hypothetical protein